MGEFAQKVFDVVRRVPRGRVVTYGQVARMIGHPRSARYVGYALHSNPNPGSEDGAAPCHRVVFANGGICDGYAFGGPDVQRAMLESEGVTFLDDRHVDLSACQWDGRDEASCAPSGPPADFDWERELEEDRSDR